LLKNKTKKRSELNYCFKHKPRLSRKYEFRKLYLLNAPLSKVRQTRQIPQVCDGISKERLIKKGNSGTEERVTAHLKIMSKIIKMKIQQQSLQYLLQCLCW